MQTITMQVPEFVKHILRTFLQSQYEIYIVGGAVRDLLIPRNLTDWDFTTNATPEQILELFSHTYYENEFGTVGVIDPQEQSQAEHENLPVTVYEITTFRTEHGYSDKRRPDRIEWGSSLHEDLQRRDFTISAIALKPISVDDQTFEIIDPFAGQQDLKDRVIRAVGSPHQRFFEDALRMLRAVRFAAQLGFSIEPQTFSAITEHSSSLNHIAFERIRDEFFKILISQYADQAMVLLYNSGLLSHILPELLASRGVEQSGHHTDDVWTHSLKSLASCPSTDPIVKFATLIHDVGKPATRAFVCNSCHTFFKIPHDLHTPSVPEVSCPQCHTINHYRKSVVFHNHEVAGARMAAVIADRFRLSKRDKHRLVKLVRWHMFTVDERQTDKAIRRFIRNVGIEYLDDMLDLRIGDRLGGGARESSWRLEKFKHRLHEVQQQPFSVHDLKITGHDIMNTLNIPPGRQIGQILNQLYDEVVNQQLPNDPTALTERIRALHIPS